MTGSTQLRCAIYTRKSSEEGLEQAFNSLHAQRELCEAYVRSQAGERWRLDPDHYDAGGHSGATMVRPALQRLMVDVAARRIDVVVVYKVDRLTRSLSDFARIIEAFDRAKVSFVSVTQAFNTTTSMGRLDGQTISDFEADLENNRYKLWNHLSSGSYIPPPVRRVDIPKSDDKTCPLGIPAVADRVAQMEVKPVVRRGRHRAG